MTSTEVDSSQRGSALALIADLERTGAITRVSLSLPASVTLDQWLALLEMIDYIEGMKPWLIGDAWNFGEAKFGERSAQASMANVRPETVSAYAWVCSRIPIPERREELTFSHHRHVAQMKKRERQRWLTRAMKDGLNSRDLRAAIAADKLAGAGGSKPNPPGPASLTAPAIPPRQALLAIKQDDTWRKVATGALAALDENVECPKCGFHFSVNGA